MRSSRWRKVRFFDSAEGFVTPLSRSQVDAAVAQIEQAMRQSSLPTDIDAVRPQVTGYALGPMSDQTIERPESDPQAPQQPTPQENPPGSGEPEPNPEQPETQTDDKE